jgi:hypothetical protein
MLALAPKGDRSGESTKENGVLLFEGAAVNWAVQMPTFDRDSNRGFVRSESSKKVSESAEDARHVTE